MHTLLIAICGMCQRSSWHFNLYYLTLTFLLVSFIFIHVGHSDVHFIKLIFLLVTTYVNSHVLAVMIIFPLHFIFLLHTYYYLRYSPLRCMYPIHWPLHTALTPPDLHTPMHTSGTNYYRCIFTYYLIHTHVPRLSPLHTRFRMSRLLAFVCRWALLRRPAWAWLLGRKQRVIAWKRLCCPRVFCKRSRRLSVWWDIISRHELYEDNIYSSSLYILSIN